MDANKWTDDNIKNVIIVSDEAGTENSEILAYGLLVIEQEKFTQFVNTLRLIKRKHSCDKSIHYRTLPDSIISSRTKTAIDWLKSILVESIKDFYFFYLEVHLKHKYFENERFSEGNYLYNRFYRSAIYCVLHSKYKKKNLNIKWVLHHKEEYGNSSNDPFSKKEYLTEMIKKADVNPLSIDISERSDIREEDFAYALQFVDLLLSSTHNCIHSNSSKHGKLRVSQMASEIFHRNQKIWSIQARKFSYSRFPSETKQFVEVSKTKIAPLYYDPPETNKSLKQWF